MIVSSCLTSSSFAFASFKVYGIDVDEGMISVYIAKGIIISRSWAVDK